MNLYIYNTKSRNKELFTPISADQVKMYVCGPTVYNYVHIGNARPVVVFDTLFRVLQSLYPSVIYARNVTDIDDKIMKAAKEQGRSIEDLSAEYAQAYVEDMAGLNNLPPTITPYATHHVQDMIGMIETLLSRGHAYEAERHVLFSVKSMPEYGALSNRSLEDMLDGARVEVAPYKKYAGDFVLWKPSTATEPGWESPWGRGRPGWHLECSAMIEKHLGKTIDIHGGGRDLIFPHHENELAQSHCAHGGQEYVRYWVHNGYININGEKMSKSLGNFRTVRGLLQHYPGEVIRFALLSAHYRSELDFSMDLLDQSKASLDTLYGALRKAGDLGADPDKFELAGSKAFLALLDDLNTPIAISELHHLAKLANKSEGDDARRAAVEIKAIGAVMGLLQQDPQAWFQGSSADDVLQAEEIEALILQRNEAKVARNYVRADEIRAHLQNHNVVLEDSRSGTSWRRGSN